VVAFKEIWRPRSNGHIALDPTACASLVHPKKLRMSKAFLLSTPKLTWNPTNSFGICPHFHFFLDLEFLMKCLRCLFSLSCTPYPLRQDKYDYLFKFIIIGRVAALEAESSEFFG
jgi:hypothetical protein